MGDVQPLAGSIVVPPAPIAGIDGLAERLDRVKGRGDATAARKAAKDFESVLLYRLMEEMRRTIPESSLLGTGISKQVQGIFWYYLAQEVAEQGGIGLWRGIYKELAGPAAANSAVAPSMEQYR